MYIPSATDNVESTLFPQPACPPQITLSIKFSYFDCYEHMIIVYTVLIMLLCTYFYYKNMLVLYFLYFIVKIALY